MGIFLLQTAIVLIREFEFAVSDRKLAIVNGNFALDDWNIPLPDSKIRSF
jgi:hypothetical protein